MSNDDDIPSNNGAILTVSQIIKAVMSSAAEAKLGALFLNCRDAIPARHALEIMGHNQPPTPIQTDNTTDLGVVKKKCKQATKIHGYEAPLAPQPHSSKTVSPLLATRTHQPRGLCDQAPHVHPPPISSQDVLNPKIKIRPSLKESTQINNITIMENAQHASSARVY